MTRHHLFPEEIKTQHIQNLLDNQRRPIETVIMRDWRFRRGVERTASGASGVDIDDTGKDGLRIYFFGERRAQRVEFLNEDV